MQLHTLSLSFISERPDPINTTIVDIGIRWISLQWFIPYSGNSDIIGYNVYIRFVENESEFRPVMTSSSIGKRQANMFTTTTNSYNVTEQIIPFMRYQFAVVACNELGCGDLEAAIASPTHRTLPEGLYI